MKQTRYVTTAAVIAALAAGHMGPLATAAVAGPRHGGGEYYRDYDGGRDWRRPNRERRFSERRGNRRALRRELRREERRRIEAERRHHAYKKKKRKKKTIRNIAIGLGVLAVGAILMSEANRRHR